MVGVVHPAGEVSGKCFEHITIFYDISTASVQMVVVYTFIFGGAFHLVIVG